MRLTRETTPDGKCKYAIVRLDKIRSLSGQPNPLIQEALDMLHRFELLEYGEKGTAEECFVIKLKDQFTYPALTAYRSSVSAQATELEDAISTLERFPHHATSVMDGLRKQLNGLYEYLRDLDELLIRCMKADKKIPD